jgi:diguanylate cyclase (GGDEF)-like protein/PAS domain S-box-containing protein
MICSSDFPNFALGAALGEAVLCLPGVAMEVELNRIVKAVFGDANACYSDVNSLAQHGERCISRQVSAETCYVLSGKKGAYSEDDLRTLNSLAELTAKLFSSKAKLELDRHSSVQAQLLQTQILDQIHESVITMDLAGFILSWNRGAEQLFGYTAAEVVGQNILFLYEDAHADDEQFPGVFLENSRREIEVRRRKKSGEVFWASLSLSPLRDGLGESLGFIAYLSDITARKQAEDQINHLAYYDALTGLPNRTLFKKLVDKALQQAQRNGVIGSLLFVDLNRFKLINDTLGRQVGDALLVQVARRFRQALRENDIVARLGSDEFAVALIDVNQDFHAALVAQKLLACLEPSFRVHGHELHIGASIGVSVYPQDGVDAAQLLQKSDIAMFKAKRDAESANGGYVFYDSEMDKNIAGRLYLESGMQRALQAQEFYLLYQAKIDLHSAQVIGAEALIRWQHPEKGMISPVDFIPLAEETGLILQIDAWVLEAACGQARIWQDAGVRPFRIAVNLSAKEFAFTLPGRVRQALLRHQIASEWLELEITESMLMQNTDSVVAIMDEITALGVSLSLDDFGTGYSSLSCLKRFPIDTLKIDRSFIQGIPADPDDCAIASAIISMAKQLKHKVIAEGVETRAQFEFLKTVGCDEMQGYFFSRPVSAEDFVQLLDKNFCFKLD